MLQGRRVNKNDEIKVGKIKEIKVTFEGLDECITIRQSKGSNKTSKIRKKSKKDNDDCKVCEKSLFLNQNFTKRIAISDEHEDRVVGWLCPFCYTEFTLTDEIVQLMTKDPQGEA